MDEIKVHVVKYPDRDNLVMRYLDPISGKQVSRSTKTTSKREAERRAAKWEAELCEGRYRAQSKMTWEDFVEKYREEKLDSLAEATGDAAFTAFNHLQRTVNPARLADMTTARLSEFQRLLRREGMRETTIATHLRQLRAALSWAFRQGLLAQMPKLEMPKRAKGVSKDMRGRPIVAEELERMIAKVPDERKREPEKWQTLLRGLWFGGLRLSEALALSWDDDAPISVCTRGRYPALRITAEAEKGHCDRLLPIAPEFAEMLLAVPESERRGLVFGIYGQDGKPLSTKRASRYISSIGKAAGVITNKAESRYATAHDLRRSFGTRWARKVTPAILRELMRHRSVETTMTYYVAQSAEDVGDLLRETLGTNLGTMAAKSSRATELEPDAKADTIMG